MAETELKKKAKSKDPGWKYAYWPDINDKNKVQCDLCGLITNGGIKRQKEHLIGGFGDVKKCPNTSREIAEEMLSWMNKNKKRKPNESLATEGDSDDECEVLRHVEISREGSSTMGSSVKSSGTNKPPKGQTKGPIDAFARMSIEDFVDARRSGKKIQTTLENRWNKDHKRNVDEYIATLFYEGGIPFNVARLKCFEHAVEAIGRFGPGYKPPSYHMLRVSLLKDMVKKTNLMYEEYQKHWKREGCTLMCDGWTDKRQRKLINFLVNCSQGTFFLESVDASDKKEDTVLLYELLDKMIEKIGEENVVQVVTDNASYNVAAGRLLMAHRKKLFWTPCAAHCLDLMLEDIGKLKGYKGVIAKAKKLTTYIYTHTRLLEHMRKETKGKELVRFGVTRFATAFLTLERLNDDAIKRALRRLFSTEAWYKSVWSSTNAGKNAASIIFQVRFWHGVEDLLRASQPILQVLRLVDGDEKPAMPYIYAAMELAKEKIVQNFGSKEVKFQPILKIVDKRWQDQMHRPLHLAGFFLNPSLYFKAREKDEASCGKFETGFFSCLERMVPDLDHQDKIGDQVTMYLNERGIFGRELAIRARGRRMPIEWWVTYGGETPELKSIAIRILGLCCSASGCERNWSTFEFIHTKKRNRLEHKRLNDLVYVKYNRCLHERFKERRNHPEKFDPICLRDLDWGSEWMTQKSKNLVHDDEDLTWADVELGMEASYERPTRGSTSRAQHDVPSDDEELLEDDLEEDDDDAPWDSNEECQANQEDDEYDNHDEAIPIEVPFGFRI